ncbi:alpha/beta fold hydrolase [Arenicella chitinivorans]|nr:alpha/beta hydrolase [Arenicella chitinivorans]
MHFERAMRLSENIVGLQEQNSTLGGVLDSLAIGICVFDHSGSQIYSNQSAQRSGLSGKRLGDLNSSARGALEPASQNLPKLSQFEGTNVAFIEASKIRNASLPSNAATLAVSLPTLSKSSLEDFRKVHYLSASEANLLWALHHSRNLRKAAEQSNITYESARTYLKRIYLKTGCSDQSSLLLMIERNPLSIIRRNDDRVEDNSRVRKNFLLKDGRNLEYFDLGPEQGKLVLHFDALTGVAIDILGIPEVYLPHLVELGLRIVVPCRPGTYKSDYRPMTGLSEFTDDVCQLMDHLNAERAVLLSQAFGSCSALAFAASASDRVEQVILCAPSYPKHEPQDWRKMDVFYIISGVIGRRAPSLLKAIVPYLMRSVMQNTSKYLKRHISNSKCGADIAVLSSPTIQRRIPEMLALRTMLGTDGIVQENFLNTHGWDFDLRNISAPVHVLQGEQDNVSDPQGSRKLAAALPNAFYHSLADLGQYLLFTEWPWILEACTSTTPAKIIEINVMRTFDTGSVSAE